MFSRAMLIQGAFEGRNFQNEFSIVSSVKEECQQSQFHTLGDIDKFNDILLVEVSNNES